MELGEVLSILFLPLRFPCPFGGEMSGGFLRKEAIVSWLGDLGIVPVVQLFYPSRSRLFWQKITSRLTIV